LIVDYQYDPPTLLDVAGISTEFSGTIATQICFIYSTLKGATATCMSRAT